MRKFLIGGVVLWVLAASGAVGQQPIRTGDGLPMPEPPAVDAKPVVDKYSGIKITDSYRWLEDAKSPETRAFIDAENAYTTRYLKQAHMRNDVVDDLDALENITDTRAPRERADSYFFERRVAGEQQFSIYVRHGWTGKDERIIDPATLSRDANTSVHIANVSRDGTLIAFALQQGGADEYSVRFFNVKTKKVLEDELPAARYREVEFAPDGKSVYYSRNNKEGLTGPSACDGNAAVARCAYLWA